MSEKRYDYKLFYVDKQGKDKQTTGFAFAESSAKAREMTNILLPDDCVHSTVIVKLHV